MDTDRLNYHLTFPSKLTREDVESFVLNLNRLQSGGLFGLFGQLEAIITEVLGDDTGVHHRLTIPSQHEGLIAQLRNHTRGINIDEMWSGPAAHFTVASEYGLSDRKSVV